MQKLIFDEGCAGVCGVAVGQEIPTAPRIGAELRRGTPVRLPEVTEGQVVRHYTALSRLNFSLDTHFYPLGSCTMKYNPKFCEGAARLDGLANIHPLWASLPGGAELVQGCLAVLHETAQLLAAITGMAEVSLQPMAGAHGELAGVMIIAAYHRDRGNTQKTKMLIPDSAHGTNPASAALAGFEVVTVPSLANGEIDLVALRGLLDDRVAGLMLTNPNTLGLFERQIGEIAAAVHAVDGLLYYDGANLNALVGRYRPADMGFDVCHLNLHKTFATPHGGGGPGAGPVGVVERLRPYLPIGRVEKKADGSYWVNDDYPKSIGRLAPFFGNFGVVLRAYAYLLLLGREGLREVSDWAVLNANYMLAKLRPYYQAVTDNFCMHEAVFSGKKQGTLDVAKALIDRGFHPPTVFFPLNVPEAMMIEPTETAAKEELDRFIAAMVEIAGLATTDKQKLHEAPVTMPVGRLDELAAVKMMDFAG